MIFSRFADKDFQILITNYNKDDFYFDVSITDGINRTLYTRWSKKCGLLNVNGEASYLTLKKLNILDDLVNNEIKKEEMENKNND